MSDSAAAPTVTILDVGHGNCAILECEGHVSVFDLGTPASLAHYLIEKQVSSVDTLLMSHADADHISGMTALLAMVGSGQLSIRQVRVNGDGTKGSALWDDMLYELELLRRRDPAFDFKIGLTSSRAAEYSVGGVQVDVLAPNPYLAGKAVGGLDRTGRKITSNSLSAVIRISYMGRPVVLLPGDIDEIGVAQLEESGVDLRSEVLVYPHHGGYSQRNSVDFANKLMSLIRPNVVVFSIGRGRHANPRPEIVSAIRGASPSVWIACTQLSGNCSSAVPPQNPGHLGVVYARGREKRACCAGSMVIVLGESASIAPDRQGHASFVRGLGGGLCRPNALHGV